MIVATSLESLARRRVAGLAPRLEQPRARTFCRPRRNARRDEKAFLDRLSQVQRYTIVRQHLEVYDSAGDLVARFEARHMK